jgi:hypothetical protein
MPTLLSPGQHFIGRPSLGLAEGTHRDHLGIWCGTADQTLAKILCPVNPERRLAAVVFTRQDTQAIPFLHCALADT